MVSVESAPCTADVVGSIDGSPTGEATERCGGSADAVLRASVADGSGGCSVEVGRSSVDETVDGCGEAGGSESCVVDVDGSSPDDDGVEVTVGSVVVAGAILLVGVPPGSADDVFGAVGIVGVG